MCFLFRLLPRHPRFGEIADIGGEYVGGMGLCPRAQGQSPWSGGLRDESPQKLKAFRCRSGKFLYFL